MALIVGKSVVLDSPVPIRRASLANPDVADAIVLSPRQLYLTGKSVGGTNLTLWQENGTVWGVFDLDVGPDLTRIKEQLHDVFPGEKDIQVTAAKDHLTLSGAISSTSHLSQVLSIAESYAPKKVINLLQVAGVQQVMLEVRVAEMSRELLRRLGVNFNYTEGNKFAVSQLGALTTTGGGTIGPNGTPFDVLLTQAVTALFRFQTGSITWTGFIDALKQNNIVKILAEPTLVALSGQEASFLAGGEFPIPVPQALGVISIRFKQFGASLTFTPTVLANNKISIAVAPEVSDLDFTNAINIQGFLIPAITTRRASSVVELDDGQSFAIAGLLRDTVRQQISKFPSWGTFPSSGRCSGARDSRKTKRSWSSSPHRVWSSHWTWPNRRFPPANTSSQVISTSISWVRWKVRTGTASVERCRNRRRRTAGLKENSVTRSRRRRHEHLERRSCPCSAYDRAGKLCRPHCPQP